MGFTLKMALIAAMFFSFTLGNMSDVHALEKNKSRSAQRSKTTNKATNKPKVIASKNAKAAKIAKTNKKAKTQKIAKSTKNAKAGKAAPRQAANLAQKKSNKKLSLAAQKTAKKQKTSLKTARAKTSASKTARTKASASQNWSVTHELAVQSGAALVLDQSGNALYQKNANAVAPIASITKLMTAMVVLDSSPNLSTPITITDDDVDYLRGSRSRLHLGAVISRERALLLALMSSENRAANALARHYPGGMSAFLTAMNTKAQALGMKNTQFKDPTGLSSRNVSTAQDLAKMVSAAYRYPLIREFSTTSDVNIDVGGQELVYRNTNPLVNSASWDVGLSKTGFISEAGKCLVMQARVADKPVVIILLDSAGKQTRVGDANRIKRWMEHAQAYPRITQTAQLAEAS